MKNNNEFFKHFPTDICNELQNYITDQVMDWSVYLFTHREGRQQYAFCTKCKLDHASEGLRHGKIAECPHCRATAYVKASGRGRSKLHDESYLLWYEKSLINPNIIVARGIYSERDYRKDYRVTETKSTVVSCYLFEWGKPGQHVRKMQWWNRSCSWVESKKPFSETKQSMSNIHSYHSVDNIAAVVQGTPFQYCTWEQYNITDRVEVFDFASRYKCMEFLTKFGLSHLVKGKIEGLPTYGAVNWSGDTPEKVMRLTKAEIKELRREKYHLEFSRLRSYQLLKQDGLTPTWDDAFKLSGLAAVSERNELSALLNMPPLDGKFNNADIKKYFLKQIRNNKRGHYAAGNVLIEYRDYLRECLELGLDTTKSSILFPNDLERAHQQTARKIIVIRDKGRDKQIVKRANELRCFSFKLNGLIIKPASSIDELVQEGKKLKHCVGGYAERYASGRCDIFFVRKESEPSQPFYTLEVRNGDIIQCRGMKNISMTDEVSQFIEQFKKTKLKKSKSTNQGVAV
ncbi:hypothetical protein ABIC86_002471 [Paenibacillus sp. DS2363]|uniref:PcfJ domain-containing protein n=1 Tax=Paenibacillus sp. DS2363 TaxID=3156427 RepID=UPI0033921EB8